MTNFSQTFFLVIVESGLLTTTLAISNTDGLLTALKLKETLVFRIITDFFPLICGGLAD